jgi:hypothetical protein
MAEETLAEMLALFPDEAERVQILEQFRNDDPDEPDFTLWDMELLATQAQLDKLQEMARFGWQACHFWEYEPGRLALWCMVKAPATEVKCGEFRHAYITPDGEHHRYEQGRK